MKLALRNFGSAPETARSFTVPFTASSPIDPPGKNSGCTTNESVLSASRAPAASSTAASPRFSECRIAECRQKKMLHQLVAQLAAAAVAHHDGGIIGQRQRAAPVGKIAASSTVRVDFRHWYLRASSRQPLAFSRHCLSKPQRRGSHPSATAASSSYQLAARG